MNRGLYILLIVHAIVTLAAGVVLMVAPAAIPATVNIQLEPREYLLSYFLGAAELAIACLSFWSRKLSEGQALRVVVLSCMVFHAATILPEVWVLLHEPSLTLAANILLRLLVLALFWYYGIFKNREQKETPFTH